MLVKVLDCGFLVIDGIVRCNLISMYWIYEFLVVRIFGRLE